MLLPLKADILGALMPWHNDPDVLACIPCIADAPPGMSTL